MWLSGLNHHKMKSQVLCATPTLGSTVIYPGQTAFSVHYLHTNQLLVTGYCYTDSNDNRQFKPHSVKILRDNSTLSFKYQISSAVSDKARYFVVIFTDVDVGVFSLPVYQLSISDCPPGFYLQSDICVCEMANSHLMDIYNCDIDAVSFTSPPTPPSGIKYYYIYVPIIQ